jgi:hypothetical protein
MLSVAALTLHVFVFVEQTLKAGSATPCELLAIAKLISGTSANHQRARCEAIDYYYY